VDVKIVTGVSSKIGMALCRKLLAAGDHLILLNRQGSRFDDSVRTLIKEFSGRVIDHYNVDLEVKTQVIAVYKSISKKHNEITSIYHNAGCLLKDKTINEQGIEQQFALNALAPFQLTSVFLPLLTPNAKIVVSGSGAHKMVRKIDLDNVIDPVNYKAMSGSYAVSKAAVRMLMSQLETENLSLHISVVDLPPTKTRMAKNDAMPTLLKVFSFLFSSPEASALKLINSKRGIVLNGLQSQQREELVKLVNTLNN